ncbi:MAG TPA: dienelactone hydrolase family protein [Alphaproteobacteria bacterium]|nr:hypothetical protein [Rhodospirillaceae bacterium]HRJ66804.1 dienelactone hydrolase family protein [Alphaproteobacteria bacterium]
MKHENGFDFVEYPCASGKADALVIILPGHANHPVMFDKLAKQIRDERPNTDILIVKAPVPLGASKEHIRKNGARGADDLYTWHKLSKNAGENAKLVLSHFFNRVPVVDQLNVFADAQLQKRGLGGDQLMLFGFSLGGAIAVQMGTRRPVAPAGVVNHSGPVFPIISPKSRPETLFVMGEKDDFFYAGKMKVEPAPPKPPKGKLKKAFDNAVNDAVSQVSLHYDDSLKRLQKAKLPVEDKVIPGLGHTINKNSFTPAMDFIRRKLGKPKAP